MNQRYFHASMTHTNHPLIHISPSVYIQFFEFVMETTVSKGITVLDFKQQIVEEAHEQGIDYNLNPDMYEMYIRTCTYTYVHP